MMAAASDLAIGSPSLTDAARFREWMRAEQSRIYLLCLRMLRNSDEADTATQDSFLKAYRFLEKGPPAPIEDPGRWLTRIAVNTCRDRLLSRRWRFFRQRATPEEEDVVLALVPATGPDPERLLFAHQVARRLSAALDALSEKQRAVFVLRHYEDRSIDEIAAVLEIDPGTAKTHLARAFAKLRTELRDLYGK